MTVNLEGRNDLWAPLSAGEEYRPLDILIVSYLGGRREIDILAGAESPYRHHSVVVAAARQFAREDQACLHEGFPERLVQLFRDNGLSLWRVPKVDYYSRKPSEERSVVRYTSPVDGRPGLNLHIQGRYDLESDLVDAWKIRQSIDGAFYVSTILYGSGGGTSTSSGVFGDEPRLVDFNFETRFDKQSFLKPPCEVPQIEQPLPQDLPEAVVEEPPIPSPWTRFISCLRGVWECICEFFSAVRAYFSS